MIALESLGCVRPPGLEGLNLALGPGELPAVVGADPEERAALVELLAGYRSESEGAFLLDGQVLTPRARRSAVVVLPHKAALTPDLNVSEHLRLLARLRNARADSAVLQKLLQFARIDKAGRRPGDLDPDAQLRLTVGLAVVGRPALVLALDPPLPVAQLMPELMEPDRALLLVTGSLQGLEGQVTRVHGLQQGKLSDGISAPAPEPGGRAFLLRVAQGATALESMLATHAGVTVDRLAQGLYRLRVMQEVAVAPMLRALVRAGVAVETITPVGEARSA